MESGTIKTIKVRSVQEPSQWKKFSFVELFYSVNRKQVIARRINKLKNMFDFLKIYIKKILK